MLESSFELQLFCWTLVDSWVKKCVYVYRTVAIHKVMINKDGVVKIHLPILVAGCLYYVDNRCALQKLVNV